MKTLLLSTLTAVLALSLQARDNPFILYEEQTGRVIESPSNSKTVTDLEEEQFIRDYQQKISGSSTSKKVTAQEKTVQKPAEKNYSKKEVDSLILKTKYENEQKAKALLQKELAKKVEPEQVVYVKPRADVVQDDNLITKNILPFVKVEFNDNKLLIHTQDEVSKKFSINKENKLVIDFKGKKNFSGSRQTLESSNFKSISTGNHSSNGFYRIVVEFASKPSNYDVNYKDSIFSISLK